MTGCINHFASSGTNSYNSRAGVEKNKRAHRRRLWFLRMDSKETARQEKGCSTDEGQVNQILSLVVSGLAMSCRADTIFPLAHNLFSNLKLS